MPAPNGFIIKPRDAVHAFKLKTSTPHTGRWASNAIAVGAGSLVEIRQPTLIAPGVTYDPDPTMRGGGGAGRFFPDPAGMSPEFDCPVNARYSGAHVEMLMAFLGQQAAPVAINDSTPTQIASTHVGELADHLDGIVGSYAIQLGSTYFELDSCKIGRWQWNIERNRRSDWIFRVVGRRWLTTGDADIQNEATEFGAVTYDGNPYDHLNGQTKLYLALEDDADLADDLTPFTTIGVDIDRRVTGEQAEDGIYRDEVYGPDEGLVGSIAVTRPRWAGNTFAKHHRDGKRLKAWIVATGPSIASSSPDTPYLAKLELPGLSIDSYDFVNQGTVGEQMTLGIYVPRTAPTQFTTVLPQLTVNTDRLTSYIPAPS